MATKIYGIKRRNTQNKGTNCWDEEVTGKVESKMEAIYSEEETWKYMST